MPILDGEKLQPGLALALSGGGFRAALFHLGALIRMNELGLLPQLQRVSSVSGGSIAAGLLACRWSALEFDGRGFAPNFEQEVVEPLLRFTGGTVDIFAGLLGLAPGLSAARALAWFYRRRLFGDANLQDLPDHPRFVFCSVNLMSGGLWRISKPYMADYRIGQLRNPRLDVAEAVAASSAFPLGLSPLRLNFKKAEIEPFEGADLNRSPFTRRAMLTDGGVYENLGIEPIWKRYRDVLVSDAGGALPVFPWRWPSPLGQLRRIAQIAHAQHGHLRSRMMIDLFSTGRRRGAYWSMTPFYRTFSADNIPALSEEDDLEADKFRVRLNRATPAEQRLLMRAGYARCDGAIRSFYLPDASPPNEASWWSSNSSSSSASRSRPSFE